MQLNGVSRMTLKDHFLLSCLAIISLLLLSVWPIPHTIGIRNILLGLGFFVALFVLWDKRCQLTWKKSLSTVIILIFFLWLIFHYFFFSIDPSAQVKELQSTWLRSFLAGFIAFSLAILLSRKPIWRICLYLGVLVPVIVYLYSYAQVVIATKNILHLNFTGLLDHKIVLGYVGVLFTAIAFGIFCFWSTGNQKLTMTKTIGGMLLLLGIVASLASFILVNTRNGIGAFVILISLWVLVYLFQSIKSRKYLLPLIFLLLLIPLGWFVIQKHLMLNNQWNTLLADIKVAYQIDRFDHWQSHAKGFPQNELGFGVNPSTYERTAWATAGLRYLSQNPMGAGLLGDSFRRMAAKNGVESHSLRFTHSGWIDLTLAVGVPGFLLLMLSMGTSFYWAMKRQTEMASVTVWLLVAIALYWLIAELATNKHFVEMLIFMLVFLGAVNAYDESEIDGSVDKSRVLT
jgi:O-Antigen ligase